MNINEFYPIIIKTRSPDYKHPFREERGSIHGFFLIIMGAGLLKMGRKCETRKAVATQASVLRFLDKKRILSVHANINVIVFSCLL